MSISLRLLLIVSIHIYGFVSCVLFLPLHSLPVLFALGARRIQSTSDAIISLEPGSSHMLIRHTFFPEHLTSCFASGLSHLFGCESCFTYFVENLQVHKIVFIRFLGNSFKIRKPLCMEWLDSRGMQSQGQINV